ncbi:hypothetical protein Syn7502_00282 [Synechococcus sp. PCC 7502]|uniref:hypothetical protein n=1 Tax=Synechococcus sp. PCC 7502 TaxID=1173263 RepID=UPI00029FD237|nr:hypothetical protein [Synechococcus sp. PCC 7502]AFY72449.1 hypothetical protein Syn7502_00282 [Synechococcus sp. PCC 7502]
MPSQSSIDMIDTQVNHLIRNAPDLATSESIKAIAPVLKNIALQQKHSKYFLVQSKGGNLVLTTLNHVSDSRISKNVIYAYPSLAIAAQNQAGLIDSEIIEVEIISLLFQLLGMPELDSLILDEKLPKEIERQKLYNLCQVQLRTQITNNIA